MSRNALVAVLLIVAALLVPFGLVGVWSQRVLLNRERFTGLSHDLLARDAIRRVLADNILEKLERKRPRLRGFESILRPQIENVLASPQFQPVFDHALGDLHDQLTNGADTLSLDLGPGLELVRAQLGRIDPRAARALPTAAEFSAIVVARRSKVPVLWGAVDATRPVAVLVPIVVVVLLGAAVAAAGRRWRAAGLVGLVVAWASAALLLLLVGARQLVGRGLGRLVARDAFDAGWDVMSNSLTHLILAVAAGGLVVAGLGFAVEFAAARRASI